MSPIEKRFGSIPDVPVLTKFESRAACSESWVHRPRLAGIDGNRRVGTYSIVLSGKYQDDEDCGDVIFYTGSGGKQKWTEEVLTKDQSWDAHPNAALERSYLTGRPIRVIRSSKCGSPYAPSSGYRYDGLYRITKRRTVTGRSGFKVCRCRLERLPDQPPLRLDGDMVTNSDSAEDSAIEDGDEIEDANDTGEESEEDSAEDIAIEDADDTGEENEEN